MDEEGTTLATELLSELKASAHRWFIAFLIMLGLELATIAGFIWYISLPVDETTVENADGNALYIGDDSTVSGGVQNGENNTQTPGNSQETEKVTE